METPAAMKLETKNTNTSKPPFDLAIQTAEQIGEVIPAIFNELLRQANLGLKGFLLLEIITSYSLDDKTSEFRTTYFETYKREYKTFIKNAQIVFTEMKNPIIKENILLTCCHANNCLKKLTTIVNNFESAKSSGIIEISETLDPTIEMSELADPTNEITESTSSPTNTTETTEITESPSSTPESIETLEYSKNSDIHNAEIHTVESHDADSDKSENSHDDLILIAEDRALFTKEVVALKASMKVFDEALQKVMQNNNKEIGGKFKVLKASHQDFNAALISILTLEHFSQRRYHQNEFECIEISLKQMDKLIQDIDAFKRCLDALHKDLDDQPKTTDTEDPIVILKQHYQFYQELYNNLGQTIKKYKLARSEVKSGNERMYVTRRNPFSPVAEFFDIDSFYARFILLEEESKMPKPLTLDLANDQLIGRFKELKSWFGLCLNNAGILFPLTLGGEFSEKSYNQYIKNFIGEYKSYIQQLKDILEKTVNPFYKIYLYKVWETSNFTVRRLLSQDKNFPFSLNKLYPEICSEMAHACIQIVSIYLEEAKSEDPLSVFLLDYAKQNFQKIPNYIESHIQLTGQKFKYEADYQALIVKSLAWAFHNSPEAFSSSLKSDNLKSDSKNESKEKEEKNEGEQKEWDGICDKFHALTFLFGKMCALSEIFLKKHYEFCLKTYQITPLLSLLKTLKNEVDQMLALFESFNSGLSNFEKHVEAFLSERKKTSLIKEKTIFHFRHVCKLLVHNLSTMQGNVKTKLCEVMLISDESDVAKLQNENMNPQGHKLNADDSEKDLQKDAKKDTQKDPEKDSQKESQKDLQKEPENSFQKAPQKDPQKYSLPNSKTDPQDDLKEKNTTFLSNLTETEATFKGGVASALSSSTPILQELEKLYQEVKDYIKDLNKALVNAEAEGNRYQQAKIRETRKRIISTQGILFSRMKSLRDDQSKSANHSSSVIDIAVSETKHKAKELKTRDTKEAKGAGSQKEAKRKKLAKQRIKEEEKKKQAKRIADEKEKQARKEQEAAVIARSKQSATKPTTVTWSASVLEYPVISSTVDDSQVTSAPVSIIQGQADLTALESAKAKAPLQTGRSNFILNVNQFAITCLEPSPLLGLAILHEPELEPEFKSNIEPIKEPILNQYQNYSQKPKSTIDLFISVAYNKIKESRKTKNGFDWTLWEQAKTAFKQAYDLALGEYQNRIEDTKLRYHRHLIFGYNMCVEELRSCPHVAYEINLKMIDIATTISWLLNSSSNIGFDPNFDFDPNANYYPSTGLR